MAGNTRGKLKENFEGVHRNIGWIQLHLEKSLVLIREHNPKLSSAVNGLHKAISALDELAQDIYSKL